MSDFPYSELDESKTHGEKSPGVVASDEFLIRLIHHPEYFEADGLLGQNAISKDDLKRRGFSMDRELHTNKEIMRARIAVQQAKNSDIRTTVFQSRVQCSSIRNIKDGQSKRSFIVIDTPVTADPARGILENIGHAGVYSSQPRSDAELRGIREGLRLLLQANLSNWTP